MSLQGGDTVMFCQLIEMLRSQGAGLMQVRFGLNAAVRCMAALKDWMNVCCGDKADFGSTVLQYSMPLLNI